MSEIQTIAEELVATRFQNKPSSLNRRAALGADLAELVLRRQEAIATIEARYQEVVDLYQQEVVPGFSDNSELEAERDTLEWVLGTLSGATVPTAESLGIDTSKDGWFTEYQRRTAADAVEAIYDADGGVDRLYELESE